MKWFLLALLLVACMASMGPDTHSIPMPSVAPGAWAEVQKCSGITNPDLSPTTVHWIEAPLVATDRFHTLIGEWRPPDSIFLDPSTINDSTVIEHELLHHLLRGPPPPMPVHPIIYFVTLCHLMKLTVGG